jgi:hypothetical protein
LTINFTLTSAFKHGIIEANISNFLKVLKFFQTSYMFESELQFSFQIDNKDVIDIKDMAFPVKSYVPKNKNGYFDIIEKKSGNYHILIMIKSSIYRIDYLEVNNKYKMNS